MQNHGSDGHENLRGPVRTCKSLSQAVPDFDEPGFGRVVDRCNVQEQSVSFLYAQDASPRRVA